MSRIARIVAVGVPHHITQRGNRRQTVFFTDVDYSAYLELLGEWCTKAELAIWAYCLMPNHVHIIVVPNRADSLHMGLKETHRRYSSRINFREGWRGYLWQGRFSSFPMDARHTYLALRYVEANPARARLVESPEQWPWSSAANRAGFAPAPALSLAPLTQDYESCLNQALPDHLSDDLRRHESTGRPIGSEFFIERLQAAYQRILRPQKRGRKPKNLV